MVQQLFTLCFIIKFFSLSVTICTFITAPHPHTYLVNQLIKHWLFIFSLSLLHFSWFSTLSIPIYLFCFCSYFSGMIRSSVYSVCFLAFCFSPYLLCVRSALSFKLHVVANRKVHFFLADEIWLTPVHRVMFSGIFQTEVTHEFIFPLM